MSRTPLIAGNWKMNGTIEEAEERVASLLPRIATADHADVAVCVPFTALQAVVDSTRGSRLGVYAQNMHHEPSGAFTGEVSAPMLSEIDVHGVVLGHSERRQLFGETDRALSPPPTTVVPGAFATASATARVPAANGGSSNAPIGPFQKTVPADAISSA